MSEPVRFRDPDSDAAPALRAVMKYAGARTPDATQIAALTEAVLARLPIRQVQSQPERSAPPTNAPPEAARAVNTLTPPTGLGAKLALLVGAAALASSWFWLTPREGTHQARGHEQDTVPPVATAPERTRSVADSAPDAGILLVPASEAPRTAAPRERAARRGRAQKSAHVETASSDASARDDSSELVLLQAARSARRGSARSALELLHEHERSYPSSAFREEREALLIEVLQQLDPVEAEQRLADFETRYPASGYREGLRQQD